MRGGFFDPSKFPEDFLAEQLRSGRRAGFAHVECGYFRALPSYIAARRLYPRVNVPVTLIYGDHDWSKPQERDEVAQLVQGSRKITLAQSGHFGSETCRSRRHRLQGARRIETRRVLGDDVPEGKVTSFPMAVKRKDDETVVFSWILWPSRKVRDEGMKRVMADPRLQPDKNPMPFDGKRLIYGGFEMIVDA
jgi:uncharacterized protein YbaA (DUF1428 family)